MINAIFFLFATYGMASVIAKEYILTDLVDKFQRWPKLYYLLTCNVCLSVWMGFTLSLCGYGVIHPIIDAFAAYTGTTILNHLFSYLFPEDPSFKTHQ